MKNLKIVVSAILLFAILAGIGYAFTPPPPPPPPVPQNLGMYDTGIDQLVTTSDFTNATVNGQTVCRACHQTTGTNTSPVNGTYSNTMGGVPTRHHRLLPGVDPVTVLNPFTNQPFGCQDCHPYTGVGTNILLERSCNACHNGTNFYADATLNAKVGNFSRPHHVNTSYDDAGIGNPAAARQCKTCHGSFVDNYNDSHYKPSYPVSYFLDSGSGVTPLATFRVTQGFPNNLVSDGLGGNLTWGGCNSCHLDNPAASPPIGENHDNHHKEILGFGRFGGTTQYQNASTPFTVPNACSVCHVIDYQNSTGHRSTFPLEITLTNPFNNNEVLSGAMEVRNSTIESVGDWEVGTTNISVNGTGCEKCHDVKTIHNIEAPNAGTQQGLGHIGNNTDCNGCHASWSQTSSMAFGAIIPTLDSISPAIIPEGQATTLTLKGGNFINDVTNPDGSVTHYTSVVSLDGVTYTPSSITDSQLAVDIPPLTAGLHELNLVKGGDTLSKLASLAVVSVPKISSASLSTAKQGTTVTITGTGLGNKPATNPQAYIVVSHAGNQVASSRVTSWTDTKIVVSFNKNTVSAGDIITVFTASAGEQQAKLTGPGGGPGNK